VWKREAAYLSETSLIVALQLCVENGGSSFLRNVAYCGFVIVCGKWRQLISPKRRLLWLCNCVWKMDAAHFSETSLIVSLQLCVENGGSSFSETSLIVSLQLCVENGGSSFFRNVADYGFTIVCEKWRQLIPPKRHLLWLCNCVWKMEAAHFSETSLIVALQLCVENGGSSFLRNVAYCVFVIVCEKWRQLISPKHRLLCVENGGSSFLRNVSYCVWKMEAAHFSETSLIVCGKWRQLISPKHRLLRLCNCVWKMEAAYFSETSLIVASLIYLHACVTRWLHVSYCFVFSRPCIRLCSALIIFLYARN
jgi:hypothetical protein